MRRRIDWEARLDAALRAGEAAAGFYDGRRDCCLAIADLIAAMTGVDLGAPFRGYDGEPEALAIMRSYGGAWGLAAYSANQHGLQEVPVALAQRGDLVALRDAEGGETIGLVDLSGTHAVKALETGWQRVPLDHCARAWRIG